MMLLHGTIQIGSVLFVALRCVRNGCLFRVSGWEPGSSELWSEQFCCKAPRTVNIGSVRRAQIPII
jgi:hypothetical protein